ncbi:MAG: hypothetical protein ACOWWO_01050 [Peptococcaceae bacterium]
MSDQIQFTLTVDEGKWLIAKATMEIDIVKRALKEGKIILKGGTTVSCVAEILTGSPLKISGRVTPNGTKSMKAFSDYPHNVLVEGDHAENIDARLIDELLQLKSDDVLITGANIIDTEGNAAMMAGSVLGGNMGKSINTLTTEGFHVFILAGLEKLIPGKVSDVLRISGRKRNVYSMGMSCGLFPVFGKVVTEIEALHIIEPGCDVYIIGRGGIQGAQGATTFAVRGTENQLQNILKAVCGVKRKGSSGLAESLIECSFPNENCRTHLGCSYANKNKLRIK